MCVSFNYFMNELNYDDDRVMISDELKKLNVELFMNLCFVCVGVCAVNN